ncbi:cytotoxic translational repressor of toxin-antitoxin stability system [Geomonas sp.]|uniref:type II toxin-antitoxin system RelE family toxin n=1 Tax=Geomonas sp. TaxID=2651584 RepID=UPI002B47FB8F|nr:cytotoxic translational repressor of toxin-antitoxin stability system [Geomonas sp.]HJV35396.1 cytotoxic translational repressor of toxin-antitoxin stability system [Geomonas sp.]
MPWTVAFTNKAAKQYKKLPKAVRDSIDALMVEIRVAGPVRGNWPHHSKLSESEHHCHVKRGKPTYVVVWREYKDQVRLVEVTYAGTHEQAPY